MAPRASKIEAPKIDGRTYEEICRETSALAQSLTPWRPSAHGETDVGEALIRIFSHMAHTVVDRLNQVPDKNLLSFLDLIGVQVQPPLPARAPVTFLLAGGRELDGFVPKATQVASSPAEGESSETVYETESSLVVTRSVLGSVFVREPDADRYGDYTAPATGLEDTVFPALAGGPLIEHSIYLAPGLDFLLEAPKTVTVLIDSPEAWALYGLPIAWSYWNGEGWRPLSSTAVLHSNTRLQYSFPEFEADGFPPPLPCTVDGAEHAWLRATLDTPLPCGELSELDLDQARYELRREGIAPVCATGEKLLDSHEIIHPFGDEEPLQAFYISAEEAFLRPGATVSLDFDFDQPGAPSSDLELEWSISAIGGWQPLGRSRPEPDAPGFASPAMDLYGFDDVTNGFSQSGSVSFRVPADWDTVEVAGQIGRWVRVEVATGNYRASGDLQAPQIRALTASYRWELPRIDRAAADVRIQRRGLPVDQAFFNTQALDPSKDFYPFGETPQFNDTLYLSCAEAWANGGSEITIDVTLSNPNPSAAGSPPIPPVSANAVVLVWETWTGQAWRELGRSASLFSMDDSGETDFVDRTRAFTQNNQRLTLRLPDDISVTEVNGVSDYWVRARIVQGDYGTPATYRLAAQTYTISGDPVTTVTYNAYEPVAATFAPPSISSITIGYELGGISNPGTAGLPADSLLACKTYNDFSYSDVDADSSSSPYWLPFVPPQDPLPSLYLGFDRPFSNRANCLFLQVEPQLYEAAGPASASQPPRVVWEYWGSLGWTHLGASDETASLADRGLVSFIGPADFLESTEFGRSAWWLRARLDQGQFRAAPRLRRILTNTTWARNAVTTVNEVLGSSTGDPGQVFVTTKRPVLAGQQVQVKEPEEPTPGERAAIVAEEGNQAVSLDSGGGYWVTWHAVPEFYASGPRDRHYVLDHISGILRFGDGRQGMVPPRGRNNIRASQIQSGGGVSGNRAAGSITQLKSAVPYIDGVTNLQPASGGTGQESLAEVKERGPRTLRHRWRAVTGQDFEDLAHEASSEVARARAVVSRNGSDAGTVSLVIVPGTDDARPVPSLGLIKRLEDYLGERSDPTVDLQVVGPDWVEVSVRAEVSPVSLDAADALQGSILAALRRYLHPLTGGEDGRGWAFGESPQQSSLYSLIDSIQGVDHVLRVQSTEDEAGLVRPGRRLVFSGDHTVELVAPV